MVLCGEESIENVSEWRVVNRNREIGNFSTSLRLPFTPSLQDVKCTVERNFQGHFYLTISLAPSPLPHCNVVFLVSKQHLLKYFALQEVGVERNPWEGILSAVNLLIAMLLKLGTANFSFVSFPFHEECHLHLKVLTVDIFKAFL